jgi:hypothetical protein
MIIKMGIRNDEKYIRKKCTSEKTECDSDCLFPQRKEQEIKTTQKQKMSINS